MDMLYVKNVGTRHSVRNMARGKFCILFTISRLICEMKIYRNDDAYRHKTQFMSCKQTACVCMQNFAAVCCAISEEIAHRDESQLSVII